MGVLRAVQASARPSMVSLNCHITSGFSGLPKLRQLVAAMGRAPLAATLRAASATACMAPTPGLSWHHRPFASVEGGVAGLTAPVSGSLMLTRAGLVAPVPAKEFLRTIL